MTEEERKATGEDEQLHALYERIRDSAGFRYHHETNNLFQHLWRKRYAYSDAEDIWTNALEQKAKFAKDSSSGSRVRDRCRALRIALDDYAAELREGWHIELPAAVRNKGYRLEWTRVRDRLSATQSFWEPHLAIGSRRSDPSVSVVYPELLFYQHWPSHFTFRYYHLNAQDEIMALHELKARHPKMHRDGLLAAHPYVPAGDIEARDMITQWFDRNAMVKVEHVVPRRNSSPAIAEGSLILLRSSASNPLVRDILTHPTAPQLAFYLHAEGVIANSRRSYRITIKGTPKPPGDAEMQRLAPYKPVRVGSDYQLDFSREQGVELAILCRIPNPHGGAPVTIFNTESDRAVYQLARLVTDESRLSAAMDAYDATQPEPWPRPAPASFEILYALHLGSASTEDREASLEPLAWRIY
jgi:hypothetical protein